MVDRPLLVGLDVGTSRIKAMVFDDRGQAVVASDAATPTITTSEGWVEYDPAALWQTACERLRDCVARVDRPSAIAGIAVASMGESAVPLDRADNALGP